MGRRGRRETAPSLASSFVPSVPSVPSLPSAYIPTLNPTNGAVSNRLYRAGPLRSSYPIT